MFFSGSRYSATAPYQTTKQDGTVVTATRLPLPSRAALQGYYARQNSQRLDQIASHFLSDATTFWRLCDANNSIAPDTLAVHPLIGIPGAS